MRKLRFLTIGLSLLLLAPVQVSASEELLEFDSMIPVSGIFLGTAKPANPVRGLDGGNAPWAITEGQGQLSATGDVEVEVKGLIVAPLGFNPVPNFQVIVSCLTTSNQVVNVSAGNMEMEDVAAGNAHLETHVTLPSTCNAPIVFVTSPGTPARWFAASSLS